MTAVETATSPTHLMRLFADHAAAGDTEALLDLYEPDAVFEPQPGIVLRGTAQIREALTELTAMRPTIAYTGETGCLVVGDIALVSNTWTMTGHLPGPGVHREGGVSADVLRRQADGSWLILIDQPRGAVSGT